MADPIVTLTTDFGLADHFVGVMKGVILGIAPRVHMVDICHGVEPFSVEEGGFTIAQAYPYFPPGTVHVVVVDPGVGTSRRPILAEAAGQFFVAPDNGVLSMIYEAGQHRVRAVTSEKYFLKPVSATFHGRDVFAPVAAHLARGLRPSRFGALIDDYCRLEFFRPVCVSEGRWVGRVLKTDSFGNLVTNFRAADLPGLAAGGFRVRAGRRSVTRFVRTFAGAGPGELALVEGSSGYVEIVANRASAADMTGCRPGDELKLSIG